MLKYIAIGSSIEKMGVPVRFLRNQYELFAWSESVERSEIEYLLDYLSKKGWIEPPELGIPGPGWKIKVEGHSRVEALGFEERTLDRSQAFVAMEFDDRMVQAYEKGIGPAIETTGYLPLAINRKDHSNRIDDEIDADIRRSRFVVDDFTHGDTGASGGVYYEAGLAKGRDLPVIFTCRENSLGTLHFDTNHYNHIVWSTPEELLEKLKSRILALIGEGRKFLCNHIKSGTSQYAQSLSKPKFGPIGGISRRVKDHAAAGKSVLRLSQLSSQCR